VSAARGSGVIVLLDYMAKTTGAFENLLRVNRDGEPIWVAPLPDKRASDCYVEVDDEGGSLVAHSWNGIRAELNWEDGTVVWSAFTK